MRIILAVLALFAGSTLASAQPAAKSPEQLLSADCLVYFRYDGYEPHRKAYDQTVLAKVMKEGLGEFFDHVFAQLTGLAGGDARKPMKDARPRPEVDGVLECLSKHGFVLGLEVAPPGVAALRTEDLFHFTLVFPQGGQKKHRDAFDKLFRSATGALELPVAEIKNGGRTIQSITRADMQAAWWVEGNHMVCTLGALPVPRSLSVIEGRRPNLTTAKWYSEFAAFKRYETDMGGYVNLAGIVDRLAIVGLEDPGLENFKGRFERHLLLRHLGLTGLKDLTVHLGFDGKYQRSTVRLGVVEPEQRGGLLRLATSGPIAYGLDKLPPLPPDADYVSVRHVDWAGVFDYIRTSYGLLTVSNLLKSGELPARFPDLDRVIGGDFRKDFLDQLDTTLVSYGAHSEGPFFLGQGFAVKVKNAGKVRKGLAAITKELSINSDTLAVEKSMYRGQELHVFSKLFVPVTYTIHNDWLVFGLFPQPVRGFVMRSGGKYKVWQKPLEADEALANEMRENGRSKLLGVSVSDPRAAIEIGLALLPALVQTMNQTMGMKLLDVTKIPNAQSVNEWLFPNITLCYDDGHAIRWEHHYSINEPDDFFLLSLSQYGVSLALNFIPSAFPSPAPRRVEPKAPGEVIPVAPARVEENPPALMCQATAFEKDGRIQIRVSVPRQVRYAVVNKVPYTVQRSEKVNGKIRTVVETNYREVTEFVSKTVFEESLLTADGNTVEVTRKDGTVVLSKELPKLLERETWVLFVRRGEVSAAARAEVTERTLIIRVLSLP